MSARKCPVCHKNSLYVKYSYPRYDGLQQIGVTHKVIRRRLECEECGHAMTTYEIEAQDLTKIRDTVHLIKKKARMSKTVMGRLGTAIRHCQEDLERIAKE